MKSWQPKNSVYTRSFLVTMVIITAINVGLIVYASILTFGCKP